MTEKNKPLYMISIVSEMLKIHPQTLRLYERKGLIKPSRTVGRTRLYSQDDIEELERILRLSRELGINLAGVEVILKMRERIEELQKELNEVIDVLRREMKEEFKDFEKKFKGGLVKVPAGGLKRFGDL